LINLQVAMQLNSGSGNGGRTNSAPDGAPRCGGGEREEL